MPENGMKSVAIPEELHFRLKKVALDAGKKLGDLVTELLRAALKGKK